MNDPICHNGIKVHGHMKMDAGAEFSPAVFRSIGQAISFIDRPL